MKKVLLVVLTLWSTFSFGQTRFNHDSVNYYFMNMVNQYRNSNGLPSLTLNLGLKNFADNHVKYLAVNHNKSIVHSIQPLANGDMTYFRKILDQMFGSNSYFVENVASSVIYEKTEHTEIGDYPYPDLKEVYQKMLDEGPSNKILAKCAFLLWKNSPKHNGVLLHNQIKRFYMSYSNHHDLYFFEFVALNQ